MKKPKKLTPKQRAYLIGKAKAYRAPKFDDRIVEKSPPRPITPEEERVVEAVLSIWSSTSDLPGLIGDAADKLLAARAKEAK